MGSLLSFLRPSAPAPAQVDIQRLVYDLVLERAQAMFGPGSSFTVSVRTEAEDDAMFNATIAETLAWDCSLHVEAKSVQAKSLDTGRLAS